MKNKENVENHNTSDIGIPRWIVSRSILSILSEIWDFEKISYVIKFLNALEHLTYFSYDEKSSILHLNLVVGSDIDDIRTGLSLVCEYGLVGKLEILGMELDACGDTLKDSKFIMIHHMIASKITSNGEYLSIDFKATVHRNKCIHDICEELMNVQNDLIGAFMNETKNAYNCNSLHENKD